MTGRIEGTSRHPDEGMVCAFIGAFPDPADPDLAAYSPAGASMQRRLLASLTRAGVATTDVFALRTTRSFPRGRRLVHGYRRADVGTGTGNAALLPFVNVPLLKQLTSGLATVLLAMAWGWRNRGRRRVLLAYNVACPPGHAITLAARLAGAKACAIVADLEVPGSGLVPDNLARRVDYGLQRASLRRFDGLIVLTQAVALDNAADVPTLQMEGAVPPELEAAVPDRRPDRAADPDSFVVMYAGDLSELKGIPLLLEAFARLEGERFRLWIAGKGDLAPVVEGAARADQRIVYWGFPSYERLLELFRQADVLVNPHSTTHGSARYLFPSKLIEYLATGTAVISTCSNEEVRKYADYLLLLEESTPAALARAIETVAVMPASERVRLGAAGREFVLANKTWTRQAARIRDFLSTLAQGRPA